MPVRDSLNRTDLPGERELRAAIEAELRNPQATGEPDIVIERPHPGTVHLFVIWSKFDGLEQSLRSRVSLDAFVAVHPGDAQKVTVAMGLTAEEARRMGVG